MSRKKQPKEHMRELLQMEVPYMIDYCMNLELPATLEPYYEDEFAVIFHGDSLPYMIALALSGIRVDHVITDPPYEDEAHNNQTRQKGYEHHRLANTIDYGAVTRSALEFTPIGTRRDLYGYLIAILAKRWAVTFCQLEAAMLWRNALEFGGYHRYVRTMTWWKPNGMPQFSGDRPAANYENMVVTHPPTRMEWNGGGSGSILTCRTHSDSKRIGKQPHPTQKPLPLMEELVALFSNYYDLILDPFGGSGTTAVAAKKNRRYCIMIERELQYCAVAAKRLRETQPMAEINRTHFTQDAMSF